MFCDDDWNAEPGIDGGGLTRELMTLLMKEIFDSKSNLFTVTSQGEFYPCHVDLTADLRNRYRFVGEVLGRSLLCDHLCISKLAPFFLNIVR